MSWRLLAVHAHPDDESITMGGTLAHYATTGVQVTLVTCTLGEEGEVIGADLAGLVSAEADQLGGYRLTELQAACRALGVQDHRFLGGLGAYRDSGMAGSPSAEHPRAFVHAALGGPDHGRAVASLVAIIDEIKPHILLTYDEDGGYGHPDHVTAHQVAVEAAKAAGVQRVMAVVRSAPAAERAIATLEVPAGFLPPAPKDLGYFAPAREIAAQLWVASVEDERRAALAAHGTQIEMLDDGFALSNRIAQPLFSSEYFKVLAGQPFPANSAPATDLFLGLTP